jgi:hypothetical protein
MPSEIDTFAKTPPRPRRGFQVADVVNYIRTHFGNHYKTMR